MRVIGRIEEVVTLLFKGVTSHKNVEIDFSLLHDREEYFFHLVFWVLWKSICYLFSQTIGNEWVQYSSHFKQNR